MLPYGRFIVTTQYCVQNNPFYFLFVRDIRKLTLWLKFTLAPLFLQITCKYDLYVFYRLKTNSFIAPQFSTFKIQLYVHIVFVLKGLALVS